MTGREAPPWRAEAPVEARRASAHPREPEPTIRRSRWNPLAGARTGRSARRSSADDAAAAEADLLFVRTTDRQRPWVTAVGRATGARQVRRGSPANRLGRCSCSPRPPVKTRARPGGPRGEPPVGGSSPADNRPRVGPHPGVRRLRGPRTASYVAELVDALLRRRRWPPSRAASLGDQRRACGFAVGAAAGGPVAVGSAAALEIAPASISSSPAHPPAIDRWARRAAAELWVPGTVFRPEKKQKIRGRGVGAKKISLSRVAARCMPRGGVAIRRWRALRAGPREYLRRGGPSGSRRSPPGVRRRSAGFTAARTRTRGPRANAWSRDGHPGPLVGRPCARWRYLPGQARCAPRPPGAPGD